MNYKGEKNSNPGDSKRRKLAKSIIMHKVVASLMCGDWYSFYHASLDDHD